MQPRAARAARAAMRTTATMTRRRTTMMLLKKDQVKLVDLVCVTLILGMRKVFLSAAEEGSGKQTGDRNIRLARYSGH